MIIIIITIINISVDITFFLALIHINIICNFNNIMAIIMITKLLTYFNINYLRAIKL